MRESYSWLVVRDALDSMGLCEMRRAAGLYPERRVQAFRN